jgi:hypothetical protein
MSITAERIDDVFQLPAAEALPILRSAGLLPERPTEVLWKPNPADVQPSAAAALAQIDPRHPFTSSRASMSAFGPQWFTTGAPEVSIRSQMGSLNGVIYLNFSTLGANRKCIAWFDLLVYGPTGSSLTLGGTGNPSTVVVSQAATGGQRTWVPFALTASSSGQATAYIVPTLSGHGGAWYGTTLYGL